MGDDTTNHYLTEEDIQAGIAETLDWCGCTLEQLWDEMREGRSSSEKARLAVFTIEGVGGFDQLRGTTTA